MMVLRRNFSDGRRKAIKRTLLRHRLNGAPKALKDGLRERSGGWCEMVLPGCQGRGVDPAHRIGTKMGGRSREGVERHHRLSNALWACRSCHDWTHASPVEAKELGLMLEEWQEPTEEPVARRNELVFLADDGSWDAVR